MVDRKRALQAAPKDTQIGLRHAVLIPLVLGLAMGPGCGAMLGSLYGKPYEGMIVGAGLLAFATAVAMPAMIKRGIRRGL